MNLTAFWPQAARAFALLGAVAGGSMAMAQSSEPPQEILEGVTLSSPGDFYSPPPGKLLRVEKLTGVTLPQGIEGWRILYLTTVDDATPATAVAVVFASTNPPPGPRPVIDWVHGTTGLLQRCMPSLVSVPHRGIPALVESISAGWVVVATDYSFAEKGGPHPYIIGPGEARAGLDAVRAAHEISGLTLDKKTAVWGHSQGGHSALWTGIIGPQYAPDLELVGVAAIAPAADMGRILKENQSVNTRLGPYVAAAYSRFYPDIKFDDAIRPEALAGSKEIVGLCGFIPAESARIAQIMAATAGPALALDADRAFAARLAENKADKMIAVPVLVAQGTTDTVVLPAVTDGYVAERCAAGQSIAYLKISGRDHAGIVKPDSPLSQPLVAWTADRFAGKAAPKGCSTTEF